MGQCSCAFPLSFFSFPPCSAAAAAGGAAAAAVNTAAAAADVAKHGIVAFRLIGWTITSDLNFRNTECWKLSSERCIVGGQRSGRPEARLPKAGGVRRKISLFLFNPKAVAIFGLFFVLRARLLHFPVSDAAPMYKYLYVWMYVYTYIYIQI